MIVEGKNRQKINIPFENIDDFLKENPQFITEKKEDIEENTEIAPVPKPSRVRKMPKSEISSPVVNVWCEGYYGC